MPSSTLGRLPHCPKATQALPVAASWSKALGCWRRDIRTRPRLPPRRPRCCRRLMRSSALRLLGQQAVRRVGASSSQAAPALLLRSTAWQPSPAGALFALGGSGGACGRPGMLIPRFLCSSSDDSGGDGDDKAAKKRFGKKKPPPAAAAAVDMDADPDAEVVS